jgi:hypothetical protein
LNLAPSDPVVSLAGVREPTLADLRKTLLRGLRTARSLRDGEGELAFERHQLLAARFLRVARLNRRPGAKNREGWLAYFDEHFPRGSEHARLLWDDWRKPLLQRGAAGMRVTITHGQRELHWKPSHGAAGVGIVVDLESMWSDFGQSIESFVDACSADRAREKRALRRWRASTWTAQQLVHARTSENVYSLDPMLGSASTSTAWQAVVYSMRAVS